MMSEKLLCPSLMCVDFSHLADEIKMLDEAGADIFHCDIMDGNFVDNFTLGTRDIKAAKDNTDKLIDCHLMIENPRNKVDWFIDAGADIIYIHPETEKQTTRTLMHIRERGRYAGIAISPDISVASIKELLNVCDYVLVMTVNPGFAGQKFVPFTREKVKELGQLKEKYGYKLMIDGACSPEIIAELSQMGADGFVLGTSALFGKGKPYKELMDGLREL